MAILSKSKQLKKELTLINVYAITVGTILSGGFFLLPGLAAQQVGAAIPLSYLLAAVPLIPAMLCKIELATAMPRAGGTYYFLDRSMGPLMGTIGGLGTWLSLMLKTAFGLIGMGAYLSLFMTGNNIIPIAIAFAIFFGVLNLWGAKETAGIQVFLVAGILGILTWFIAKGIPSIQTFHFDGFFNAGTNAIISSAGFVSVSYIGVTKMTSVAEEVKDPEKNIPLGMILGFVTCLLIYVLGTSIMVGVLPMDQLVGNLTPVASVAEMVAGNTGKIIVTIAAVFAFASVTNAGILSASRYPLAMSRDHLISGRFKELTQKGIPRNAIIITLVLIILSLVLFNPTKIAKLASAFQLMIFSLCCLAVIIMRESHIEAYDPGFRSPWYPWLPIFGIITPFCLVFEMGLMPILFSCGLVLTGVIWYVYYARKRTNRGGAIYHVFERLGKRRYEGLEPEMRSILKEKGLRDHDPFDEIVARAQVIEVTKYTRFDDIILEASELLSEKVSYPADKIAKELLDGTKVGGTPVSHGVALPHMRLHHILEPEILIVRSKKPMDVNLGEEFWGDHTPDGPIHAIFFLISPEENPRQHLRILAKIAGRVDDEDFLRDWIKADDEQELKEILLRDEYFMALILNKTNNSGKLIGSVLRELEMPDESLIAIIRRDGKTIVPKGSTKLEERDRLTIIGNQKGISEFRKRYG